MRENDDDLGFIYYTFMKPSKSYGKRKQNPCCQGLYID